MSRIEEKNNEEFNSIFFRNEYRKLAGNKNSVVKRLAILLVITLTSIGFAVGGLDQLDERMNNPFTNWVDLDITSSVEKKMTNLKLELMDSDTLDNYNLDGVGDWNRLFLWFYSNDYNPIEYRTDTLAYLRRGRTVDFDDLLFEEIINEESDNLLYKNESYFNSDGEVISPCGIIVTESLMEKIGYLPEEYDSIQYLGVSLEQNRYVVFFELLGIVKHLPSLCHFVTTNRMHNITQDTEYDDHIIRNSPYDSLTIRLLSEQPNKKVELQEWVQSKLNREDFDISTDIITVDKNKKYYTYIIRIINTNAPRANEITALTKELKDQGIYTDYSYIQCGEDADNTFSPGYVSFNFNDLDEVKSFRQKLYNEYDIELAMEQVESRENFRLVTWLTSTISVVLFGLGLLSILLYLGNLIQNHIMNIRTNLGTLKAMGLPNKLLQSSYTKIVIRLLGFSLLVALPIVIILGWSINYFFLKIGFSLLHWSIPVAIILMVLVVVLIVKKILDSILSDTPGNLIYERG